MAGKSFQGSWMQEIVYVLRGILALMIILAMTYWFDHMSGRTLQQNGLFTLGFLVLAGTAGGRLAALFGLPQLTGYLVAGLIVGPSGVEILREEEVQQLGLLNSLALALIALQAGCSLTKAMLEKSFKSLAWASLSHMLIITFGMMLLFAIAFPYLGLPDLAWPGILALGLLWGTISVSKSPAAVVAVIGETKSKGPLSEHAIGLVVTTSILVLVFFSLSLMLAQSMVTPGGTFSSQEFFELIKALGSSVAAGTTFGLIMVTYFKLIDRERILFLLLVGYGITAFCRFFGFDTMLVFVVAGFIVVNLSHQGDKVRQSIDSVSSVVMIVFFATAGAALHLHDLIEIWPMVVVFVLGRILFTWLAQRAGSYIAKDSDQIKKFGTTPFVAQAGLTIGLAILMTEKLPEVGIKLATLTITVGAVNEIIGPVIFKWGLQKAKEIPSPSEET